MASSTSLTMSQPDTQNTNKLPSNEISTTNGLETSPVFHRFPDFPKEVRLKIWRYSLAQPLLIHIYFIDLRCNEPNLPSCLHVNHESRTETLRHIQIIERSPVFFETYVRTPLFKPLLMNGSSDTVSIKWDQGICWKDDLRLADKYWRNWITSQTVDRVFAKIKTVEIRDVEIHSAKENHEQENQDEWAGILRELTHFHDLEVLVLRNPYIGSEFFRSLCEAHQWYRTRVVERALEEVKADGYFEGRKIKVVFQDWELFPGQEWW